MAFSAILTAAISVGSAVKRDLWLKVKDNFNDHESRINAVEAGSSRKSIWEFEIINASAFSSATGVLFFEATQSFTITNASFRIFEVGSLTGDLELDVLKSTTDLDSGSFTSIFTTKPSVDYSTASDYDASTNQVFDSGEINILAGDFLRLDITQAPSGVASKFLLSVYGE